jgi:hypothetical protein
MGMEAAVDIRRLKKTVYQLMKPNVVEAAVEVKRGSVPRLATHLLTMFEYIQTSLTLFFKLFNPILASFCGRICYIHDGNGLLKKQYCSFFVLIL